MFNDLPFELRSDEVLRNAYNAAFYDLGLRWYWDGKTWDELRRHSADVHERVRHYLETRQPHLLKAYDADFLVHAIQTHMEQHRHCTPRHFNWAQGVECELGV